MFGSGDEGSDDSEFEDIKEYFAPNEFAELPTLIKTSYRNQKQRFMASQESGLPLLMPQFMRSFVTKNMKRKKTAEKPSVPPSRQSKRLKEVPQNPLMEQAQEEKEEPFPDIKPFFTPAVWRKMSLVAKRHLQLAKSNYDEALNNGLSPQMPRFMSNVSRANGIEASGSSSSSNTGTGTGNEAASSTPSMSELPDSGGVQTSKPTMTTTIGSKRLTGVMPSSDFLTSDNDTDPSLPVVDFNFSMSDDTFLGGGSIEDPTDELRKDIEKIVLAAVSDLSQNVLTKITSLLIDKGIESVNDLDIVQQNWLQDLQKGKDLTEVQLLKIMRNFAKCGGDFDVEMSDKENMNKKCPPNNKKKSTATPLLREVQAEPEQAINSRPRLAMEMLPTHVLDYSIQWGKMRDSLLTSLENKVRPKPCDRDNMVLVISKDIKEAYEQVKIQNPSLTQKTPGRKVYRAVVKAIFSKFKECFIDEIRGEVVGDGMFSLTDQFETCIENSYRARTAGSQRPPSVKGNRNAAGILPDRYAPIMSKADKANAESTRLQLLTIYRSGQEWNWDSIKEKMISSIAAQRSMVVAKKRIIADIIERWPFLFELSGMVCHLDYITNSSLMNSFRSFMDSELDSLLNYLTIMSEARIANMKIQKSMATNGQNQRLLAAILMLANHFGEDHKILLSSVEETTMPHEDPDILDLPSTPTIVALAERPFEANKYLIFIEKECVVSVENAAESIIALCASYFVFGILYPAQLSTTLTYVERVMAQLHDGTGLVKATTSKGAATKTSITKVMTFIKKVEEFEKEMGDD